MVLIISSLAAFWSHFSCHSCLFFSEVRIKLLVGLYIAFSAYIGIYLAIALLGPWYMKIWSISETFLSFPPPPPILPEQTTAAMIPIITTPLINNFILDGWNYNITKIRMTHQIHISIALWSTIYTYGTGNTTSDGSSVSFFLLDHNFDLFSRTRNLNPTKMAFLCFS